VLVEPADLQLARAVQPPGLQAERASGELGEGRLAGAVDAQQADAVVDVEPQLQLAEDRRAPVADRAALDPQQRRGQGREVRSRSRR